MKSYIMYQSLKHNNSLSQKRGTTADAMAPPLTFEYDVNLLYYMLFASDIASFLIIDASAKTTKLKIIIRLKL